MTPKGKIEADKRLRVGAGVNLEDVTEYSSHINKIEKEAQTVV